MRKIILFFLCLTFTLSLVLVAASDNILVLDVNVCDEKCNPSKNLNKKSNSDSLGSYFSLTFPKEVLTVKLEDEVEYEPHLSVSFTLEKEDSVYVWIRSKIESGDISHKYSSDSIFVSFDSVLGKDYTNSSMEDIGVNYSWIRVKSATLSPGKHILNLRGRELHTEISHIKITNSSKTLVWEGSPYSEPEISLEDKSHPRVLVNPEILQKVKTVMAAPESYPDNKNFIKLHNYFLGRVNLIDKNSSIYRKEDYKVIKSLAFEYLVNQDKEKGNLAVSLIKNRFSTVKFASSEDYGSMGNLIYTSALVYDWCYDLIKDDKETKEFIIEKALEFLSLYSEMGWPPVNQNGWGGHGSENTLLRDCLALGIAVYDEYPDVYNITAGRIEDEYIGPRKVYFDAHKSLFGTDYGVHRGKNDIACALLYKALGVENIWETNEYQYMPYWYIYAERGDGYFLEDGDGRENVAYGGLKRYNPAYMSHGIGSMFSDGYLKSYSDKLLSFNVENYWGYDIYDDHIESIIANDITLEKEDLNTLSYSKYFPYPGGAYIARTGWGEDAMVVSMKINPLNISDHNHLDAGGFQIYYKGNLATDSGYYQALTEENAQALSNETGNTYYENYFGGTYHQAYYRQTIAHNCMLIENPNTPDTEFVNDWDASKNGFSLNKGGQKSNSKGANVYPDNPEDLKTDELLNTSKVLAYGQEKEVNDPDYTYLKGDLSGAYPDNTVSAYERSFMFLNFKNKEHPGALIVFDHIVSKDASYKKTFLLHGVNAPQIDEKSKRVTLTRSEKNVAPSSIVKGYSYNGKLINDTLLPKNAKITKVGENQDDYIISDTVNLRSKYVGVNTSVNEGGGIRTEITDNGSNKLSYFLNVLQVSDADSQFEPLTATLIENLLYHYGVQIYDRVVLFGKTKDRISNDISFAISDAGSYNISVADLSSGMWYIYKDGVYKGRTSVSETEGIAYFEGANGEYTLTKTPAASAIPNNSTKFYFGFGSLESENAFLTFGRISGLLNNATVLDYGMVFAKGVCEPEIGQNGVHKVSVEDKNFVISKDGVLSFGIKVYGKGILNFTPYSIRTYVVVNEDGYETVKYGTVCVDYVRNFGNFNSYPLTIYEVNE